MRYFLIAGEASGDLHASNLMRELKNTDKQAEFCFLGGDLMLAQGGKMIKHYRQMAFMGFWAVIKNAGKVLNNMNDCKNAITDFQPDVLILIDYPGFNLRMAEFAKEHLHIPVFYYISPKLWAWKEYRIKAIKKFVDKMYTIFPFETAFFAKHNYSVQYVGNPSIDSINNRPNKLQTVEDFYQKNNIPAKPIIAVLAGSRKQEISACLPRMIESAIRFNDYQAVIGGAPGIDPEYYQSIIQNNEVSIVFGQTYDLLQHANAAIVNSGTATLETALIGTPQVVVYHVIFGRIAYAIKDWFIKVKFFSLVNLVAQKEVVKEFVAHLFTVDNVSTELDKILHNQTYRENMLQAYTVMRNEFGEHNAAQNAAKRMYEDLSGLKK